MIGTAADAREVALPTCSPRGILVVDDEPAVLQMLQVAMHQFGFAAWTAANGSEAVDLYRQHQQAIDLVLLDVRMPGLDGPHTLQLLRKVDPQVRCCFMSGSTGKYTEEELIGLGAAGIMRKPFRLAEVADKLRRIQGAK